MRQTPDVQGKPRAFLFAFQGVSIIFACPKDLYLKILRFCGPAGQKRPAKFLKVIIFKLLFS
jgi:hypothetical protein